MAGLARSAPLVGLIGKAGSGKDTVGARLVAHHGYERAAFADALRAVLLDVNPLLSTYSGRPRLAALVDDVGWDTAKNNREVRRLLQALGVAIREHVAQDVWVEVVMRTVDSHPGVPYVITDVRFPNEADAIRARGGILVRIERPDAPGLGSRSLHVSETALDQYEVDYKLNNSSTLELLHERVDLLAQWASRVTDRYEAAWRAAARSALTDPRGGL